MIDMLKELARQHIPRKLCLFNDVDVQTYKWRNGTVRPDFEEAIAKELRRQCSHGDRVGIIGGGHGVCSVVAASAGAIVTVYEPGALWVNTIRKTTKLNGVGDSIEVIHAAVGPMHDVWSSPKGASMLEATDLPECDWLVLDCEGAEMDILSSLEIRPDRLSVETHPPLVQTEAAAKQIEQLGYEIYCSFMTDQADVLHARRLM